MSPVATVACVVQAPVNCVKSPQDPEYTAAAVVVDVLSRVTVCEVAVATKEYHTSSLIPVVLQDGTVSPAVAVDRKVEPATTLLHVPDGEMLRGIAWLQLSLAGNVYNKLADCHGLKDPPQFDRT